MNIFRINTTAFEEEDFFLLTDLSEEQITEVITPIVLRERNGGAFYGNDYLADAIRGNYPDALVDLYHEFDKITI
jgi:hypothetical protein